MKRVDFTAAAVHMYRETHHTVLVYSNVVSVMKLTVVFIIGIISITEGTRIYINGGTAFREWSTFIAYRTGHIWKKWAELNKNLWTLESHPHIAIEIVIRCLLINPHFMLSCLHIILIVKIKVFNKTEKHIQEI